MSATSRAADIGLKEIVEHLRTVHLSLTLACFALVVASFLRAIAGGLPLV